MTRKVRPVSSIVPANGGQRVRETNTRSVSVDTSGFSGVVSHVAGVRRDINEVDRSVFHKRHKGEYARGMAGVSLCMTRVPDYAEATLPSRYLTAAGLSSTMERGGQAYDDRRPGNG